MDELARFLQTHDITQANLAQGIGVSGAYVSMLLSGKSGASLQTANAILSFLRERTGEPVTFEQLFGSPALAPAVGE